MEKVKGIQMTLLDYFSDVENFTLSEATECVKIARNEFNAPVKEPSIRARIYEGIDKGIFTRVGKGVYTVSKTVEGKETNCLLINGNGRDLSMLEDNSIDSIITDHPYDLKSSLKGGNRDFAKYESFQYSEEDFKEKYRVLKEGCFLVEFLPEENSENYKYIYKIKEMAESVGLEYYSSVPWKKGDFVANTGRKSKNTEQVVMFTKGKCRELRLDAKKNKAMISEMMVYRFKENWNDFGSEPEPIECALLINKNDYNRVSTEMQKAFDNWMYSECEDSILLSEELTQYDLCQIPIMDYVCLWLDKQGIHYTDITEMAENIDFDRLSEKDFLDTVTNILTNIAPNKLNYMSGTNGMLPTVFDVEPVAKKNKIHQAEKPVELLEQIIGFITRKDERVLDQFAGSGVLGIASLNTGRDSILIEKDEKTFDAMSERLYAYRPKSR